MLEGDESWRRWGEVDFRMRRGGDISPFEKSRKQECFRTMEESLGRLSAEQRGFSQTLHLVGRLLQVGLGVASSAESRGRFETATSR